MGLVAFTGVRTAAAELGDTAVVVGVGLVGQYATQLLELSGVRTIAADLSKQRLEIATACGAWGTVDARPPRIRLLRSGS